MKYKYQLLRFVLSPNGTLVPDLMAKLPGRGAYTCQSTQCLIDAIRRKQFSRAFKMDLKIESAEDLVSQVASIMAERIGSYVAIANKAGKVASGTEVVTHLLKRSKEKCVVFIANDCSEGITKKIMAVAEKNGVEYFRLLSKERLGRLLGKSQRSAVSVEGVGLIGAIKEEIQRYRNFVGEGCN